MQNPILRFVNNGLITAIVSMLDARNSTGSQVQPAAMMAMHDDVAIGTVTENNIDVLRLSDDRSLLVAARAASGSTTSVAASTSSVALLAANTSRKGATIYNHGTANLYIKFGATASYTSFALIIPGNGYYEVPFGYIGQIDAIWGTADGAARVVEMV